MDDGSPASILTPPGAPDCKERPLAKGVAKGARRLRPGDQEPDIAEPVAALLNDRIAA